MAALKSEPERQKAKPARNGLDPLARVMREFEDLVLRYETGLLRSVEDASATAVHKGWRRDDIRQEACRLARAELGDRYTRKHIRRSLAAAEAQGRRVEQLLHAALDAGTLGLDDELRGIHHGYFRLYSIERFDMIC